MSENIETHTLKLGVDLAGFAPLTEIPKENRWVFDYGISIVVAYKTETILTIESIKD